MPSTTSSKKRLRQNIAHRERNRPIRTEYRNSVRRVLEAISNGEIEKAEQEFRFTTKKIDQASARNIVHRNKAARIKSRLQKRIKAAKA